MPIYNFLLGNAKLLPPAFKDLELRHAASADDHSHWQLGIAVEVVLEVKVAVSVGGIEDSTTGQLHSRSVAVASLGKSTVCSTQRHRTKLE